MQVNHLHQQLCHVDTPMGGLSCGCQLHTSQHMLTFEAWLRIRQRLFDSVWERILPHEYPLGKIFRARLKGSDPGTLNLLQVLIGGPLQEKEWA